MYGDYFAALLTKVRQVVVEKRRSNLSKEVLLYMSTLSELQGVPSLRQNLKKLTIYPTWLLAVNFYFQIYEKTFECGHDPRQ